VDYLATSLHKWLCAPVGTSLLYVKKDKIAKITPLFATLDNKSPDIRKFEVFGTHSVPVEIATGQALEFQESIGIAQKQARLQYLTDYWTSKAQKLERFELLSTKQASQMNALALFRIKGKKVEEVVNTLYSKFKIHLVQCVWENIEGVRISPNVYTSLKELDKFVEALAAL
jgi:selenocysteine lyase/cysteine desulfurase